MISNLQLSHLSPLTDALPVLIGAWYFRNISIDLVPVYFFFYFTTLQDYFTTLLAMSHYPNVWLINIYQLIESVFYPFLFHRFLSGKKMNLLFLLLLLSVFLIWTYTTFFIYSRNEPNSITRTFGGLLIVLYAGNTLIRLSKDTTVFLFYNPWFWLASGCLIYFTFSLIVYSVLPMIVGNQYIPYVYDPVWMVHSIMNIFSNLLFAITFLCLNRTSRFPPTKSFSRS